MSLAKQIRGYAASLTATVLIVACSSQQEPATHAVDSIQVALNSVGRSVQQYMPEQFVALQARASALQGALGKGDYRQVLEAAPTLMNDIQQLGAVAAAKKAQRVRTLSEQWPRWVAYLPDMIAAVQARIDALTKNRKEAAKLDLAAAQADMVEVNSSWNRAQQAYAGADPETAGAAVSEAQDKLKAAASAINFTLPHPVPAAPSGAAASAPAH